MQVHDMLYLLVVEVNYVRSEGSAVKYCLRFFAGYHRVEAEEQD